MASSPPTQFESNINKRLPSLPPDAAVDTILFGRSKKQQIIRKALLVSIAFTVLYCSYSFLFNRVVALTLANTAPLSPHSHSSPTTASVPQYFQTSPELWPGPTATGRAPFLAATNPVSFASTRTYVPNEPLETAEPIVGQEGGNQSIFRLMGHLSSYFPNPEGFGVREWPLIQGARIAQVQVSLSLTIVLFQGFC